MLLLRNKAKGTCLIVNTKDAVSIGVGKTFAVTRGHPYYGGRSYTVRLAVRFHHVMIVAYCIR